MKVLVVLCAVVASCLAKPYSAYAPSSYSYSTSVVSVNHPAVVPAPVAYAAHAPAVVHAPAPVSYAAYAPAVVHAPAPVAYAAHAPAVVHAPAPVAYAAPAPVPAVVHAPAPVAYAAAPAPVPAVVPAPAPVAYAAPAVAPVPAAAVKTQYHAQNEIGEASYGHAEPGQTHNAVQDAHGNKIGSFSYVNPEGHVLRTDYVADAAGYRVASNHLPTATVAHLHRRRRGAVLVQTPASTVPLFQHAPVAYAAPVAYPAPAPLAYAAPAPLAYTAPAPLAYPAPAPLAYPAPAPLAYAAPAAHPVGIPATLTTVVNNPGHAVSYRVD